MHITSHSQFHPLSLCLVYGVTNTQLTVEYSRQRWNVYVALPLSFVSQRMTKHLLYIYIYIYCQVFDKYGHMHTGMHLPKFTGSISKLLFQLLQLDKIMTILKALIFNRRKYRPCRNLFIERHMNNFQ